MKSQKKIAVINDFCGFGRCSIAVSLPVISAMGIQCCPVPTSVFSNHTAFDSFYSVDFTEHIERYVSQWKKLSLSFEGIQTGYLGSALQIEIVKRFFRDFKKEGTVTVVDPVMGEYGRLYTSFSEDIPERMKELVAFADIITPNLTEACILTDTPYSENKSHEELLEISKKLSDMGPGKVVISGLKKGDCLENFIFEKGRDFSVFRHPKAGPCREGTGDLFSSIITGDTVRGISFYDSVCHAGEFVAKCIARTNELGIPPTDGVCFEYFLKEI